VTTKRLLAEAKCHLLGEIINAVATIAGSAANARQGDMNRRSAKQVAAMENRVQPGDMNFEPTALSRQADPPRLPQGEGLGDVMARQQSLSAQDGKGFDYSPEATPAASVDSDFHLSPQWGQVDSMYRPPFQQDQAAQQPKKEPSNNYGQYANAASSLASTAAGLAQGPGPTGGQLPQPGNMNFQPTALAMMARRRNPYGRY